MYLPAFAALKAVRKIVWIWQDSKPVIDTVCAVLVIDNGRVIGVGPVKGDLKLVSAFPDLTTIHAHSLDVEKSLFACQTIVNSAP